jgi:hypothetical protein
MANRKISDLTALTTPATGDLLPIVDISEAAAADKNKKITYGDMFTRIPAGIGFPATAVASADVNTLDDYEEGTWTPVVSFGGASVGITGTFSGTYTKVGNVVAACYILTFTSKGTSTGSMKVAGLPFSAGSSGNTISGFSYVHRLAALQTAGQLYLDPSLTDIYPEFAGYNGNGATALTNTDISNTTDLRGGIVFRV